MALRITLEAAAIVLLLIGYINEDKVVDFERALWQAFCHRVNELIRDYERRKNHANVPQSPGR